MSIASEIERIQTAKTNLITDLNNSGFDIPQSTLINNVVTTINDDVLPLIDNRYDTFLSIESTEDVWVGDTINVTVTTPVEASGVINFNIGGWFEDSVLIKDAKAMLDVETQFSGSVAPVGENLILVSYDGDSNYKPAMATEVVTISKQPSSIAITEATVDGDALVIDCSGGTSDIGVYCESFNTGEYYSWKTGCVAIFFDGWPLGIGNLTDGCGQFLYDIGNYESGIHQIQVAFLGDNKYELSVSDPVNITIPSRIPLTFNIISAGTINWTADNTAYTKTISYSKDNGSTWTDITSNTGSSAPTINVNAGDKVMFKGNNTAYGNSSYWSNSFSGSTAEFEVEGNIMSLIDSTGFTTATTLTSSYTFYELFRDCTGLTSAENLVLPATTLIYGCYYCMFAGCTSLTTAPVLSSTTLAEGCYVCMFSGCTSLTTAPELPATTLAEKCYFSMFGGCSSLTTTPTLPATTLAEKCYFSMFGGCSSLTTAPALPATTLAHGCYQEMFGGCTSLTTAPELPATTLTEHCYRRMFAFCQSLTSAPELPATTLANSCYKEMFRGCTSLNYIKCLATDISASGCVYIWVRDVPSGGTFVKNASMSSWTTGDSGIPTGWTVQDAS